MALTDFEKICVRGVSRCLIMNVAGVHLAGTKKMTADGWLGLKSQPAVSRTALAESRANPVESNLNLTPNRDGLY